ncbi:MAG TPA: hypothetical protein VHB20_13670 [Verrucomicrobiae bacterium]|jgi:hypothetical protein|nr:hypothetical protein [Verrucomicrobiae bacterium]
MLALGGGIQAQVINFNVPGGAGAANFAGAGACPDTGRTYWNPVAGGGRTGATNLLSDGATSSPITLTSQLGGTYGTQGAQGTPAALLQPYEYNSGAIRTNTLNSVPAGSYDLYLYSINNDGTRGTTFSVTTDLMGAQSQSTVNTPESLTTFTPGADYVVFRNLAVGAGGLIRFTWTGNPNTALAGNNEGDFCGLQLARVPSAAAPPNFGASVLTFNAAMPMPQIQDQLDAVFAQQQNSEFGASRYAYFFLPGVYSNLDVNLGYYTQVLGLGRMPDDVTIAGNVHAEGVLANDNATINFWRSCENVAVIPDNNVMTWAVSQGTALRRMHILGNLNLADTIAGAYSSGGFLADSRISATVSSISQQQWLSRNDIWGNWSGQNWNMVFVGAPNAPSGTWPSSKYTVVKQTPCIAEKPYLYVETNGAYFVFVPALTTNGVSGITWSNAPTPGVYLPLSQFYLAQPATDNAASLNAALAAGQNLILTPGLYALTNSLTVSRPDAIVLGLGYPTLVPAKGFPAMVIADVDGVKVGGIIFDAGATAAPALLEVGPAKSAVSHASDPICLYDICSRVGGQTKGKTSTCVTINANDVLGDNLWLWRADHGTGVSWTQNSSSNGLVVNGDNATIYGLFVEHHEQYQTLWNGNGGRVYFYQSELPYDAPSQTSWSHNGINGYASYKIADTVTSHQAYGLGVYGVFTESTAKCFDTVETPTNSQQVNVHDIINVYITGQSGSEMTHILNGTGATLSSGFNTTTANALWTNPQFHTTAVRQGANVLVLFPTESDRSYRLQYKNALSDPAWISLTSLLGGNDTMESAPDPAVSSNRFYRVLSR